MTAQLDLFSALTPVEDDDYGRIERIIAASVRADGTLSANDWRGRMTDVNHKHVGLVVKALKRRGVLVPIGTVRSDDTRGGNAGKWIDRYRYTNP